MNILLWILQFALALLGIAGGVFKIFKFEDLAATVVAGRALPYALWAVFGLIECVTGLGLIVPGLIKGLPRATSLAAAVLALEAAIVGGIYLYYGDSAPLPFSAAMVIMGAFIAYGRRRVAQA